MRGLNMNKREVMELKKRFKKDDCTFTRMSGCYVSGEKHILLNFNRRYLFQFFYIKNIYMFSEKTFLTFF